MSKKLVGLARPISGQFMIEIKAYASAGQAVVAAFMNGTEIGRGSRPISDWEALAKQARVPDVQSLGGVFAAEPIAIKAALKLQEAVEALAAKSAPAPAPSEPAPAPAGRPEEARAEGPGDRAERPAPEGAEAPSRVELSREAKELLLASEDGLVPFDEGGGEGGGEALAELRAAGLLSEVSLALTERGRARAVRMQEKLRRLRHGVPLSEINLAGAPLAASWLVGEIAAGRPAFSDNHLLLLGDCPGEPMNDRVDASKVNFPALWERAWQHEQLVIRPVAFAVVEGRGRLVFFDNGAAITYDQYKFVCDRFEGVAFSQSASDSFVNLHAGADRVGVVAAAEGVEAPAGVLEIIRTQTSVAERKTA